MTHCLSPRSGSILSPPSSFCFFFCIPWLIPWSFTDISLQVLAQTCLIPTCLRPSSSPVVHDDLIPMIVFGRPTTSVSIQMNPAIAQYCPVLVIVTFHCLCHVVEELCNSYLLTCSRQDDVPAPSFNGEQAIFTFAKPLILMNFDSFGPTWGVQHWQLTDAFLSNKL